MKKGQFSIGAKIYNITYSSYHSCLESIVFEDGEAGIEVQIPFETLRSMLNSYNKEHIEFLSIKEKIINEGK